MRTAAGQRTKLRLHFGILFMHASGSTAASNLCSFLNWLFRAAVRIY